MYTYTYLHIQIYIHIYIYTHSQISRGDSDDCHHHSLPLPLHTHHAASRAWRWGLARRRRVWRELGCRTVHADGRGSSLRATQPRLDTVHLPSLYLYICIYIYGREADMGGGVAREFVTGCSAKTRHCPPSFIVHVYIYTYMRSQGRGLGRGWVLGSSLRAAQPRLTTSDTVSHSLTQIYHSLVGATAHLLMSRVYIYGRERMWGEFKYLFVFVCKWFFSYWDWVGRGRDESRWCVMCLYVCVSWLHIMDVRIFTVCMHCMYTYMHVCTCMYVRMNVCMYVCSTYIHTNKHACQHLSMCMYVCKYVQVHTYMHIHTLTYTHAMHTRIHMYTYTRIVASRCTGQQSHPSLGYQPFWYWFLNPNYSYPNPIKFPTHPFTAN